MGRHKTDFGFVFAMYASVAKLSSIAAFSRITRFLLRETKSRIVCGSNLTSADGRASKGRASADGRESEGLSLASVLERALSMGNATVTDPFPATTASAANSY